MRDDPRPSRQPVIERTGAVRRLWAVKSFQSLSGEIEAEQRGQYRADQSILTGSGRRLGDEQLRPQPHDLARRDARPRYHAVGVTACCPNGNNPLGTAQLRHTPDRPKTTPAP